MNMVAYCRVSTNKDDQLNSLDVQKKFFEDFAQRNNYHLVKIYADEGISGTKIKNRTQFLQLMKDSQCGFFDMVAVKDISRLARNAVDFLQCIRELKKKGIACKFVNANLDSQDSEMILGTLALVAQEESANTSKRIKFSKKINAEKGKVPNIVFGYDKTKGDYFTLSINEDEAQTIKRIYHMYFYDGMGQLKIAQELNREGILTKRRCKWSQNAIARILTNPLYTGKIINGKQEIEDFLTGVRRQKDESEWMITDAPDLQIIEQDLFDRVQKMLSKRQDAFNVTPERRSSKHIFSTLIKCSCCGYSFRRTVRTYKNTYIDWVCSGRNANGVGACPNKTRIEEAELLEEIRQYFMKLIADKPNVIGNIEKEFNRIYHSRENNIATKKSLTAKIKKLRRDKSKLMEMFKNNIMNMDELKAEVEPINLELERWENELRIVGLNLDKGAQLEEILNATFQDIESIVNMENITNAMLRRVIQKIEVDEKGHVDIYLQLFNEVGLNQNILEYHDRT